MEKPHISLLYSNSRNVKSWGKNSIDEEYSKTIRRLIGVRSYYLGQEEVAKEIGVSHSTLRNWVHGRSPISRVKFERNVRQWLEKYL